MAKLAVETRMGGLSTYTYPATPAYDSTKLGLGPLMRQFNGASAEGKFAGPFPIGLARPMETAAAIAGIYPWACSWSADVDWVFLADNATAAATRRIQLYTFNKSTASFSWVGYITLGYPFAGTQGTYTIRGFRMGYDKYTTGTAAVSGTAVTGTGTAWSTSRLAVGSRIGFGSTDPTQIVNWYEISAIGSDTSITLTTNAGTVVDGAYVIEDLRCYTAVTNGTTATNGGLFVAKGLRYETFASGGTSVAAATTTDNIRANYWLGDATTSTNTAAFGMGIQDKADWQNQTLWVGDTVANPILFKYNVRKNLTLSSGKDTTAFLFKTGSGGAVTGTTSQANNGRIATVAHGPGNGLSCFYFTTTTRIYRSVDVSTITTGSTTWLSGGDIMTEVPPGGTTSFGATGTMNSIEYSSVIDKFIILCTAAASQRSYVTKYYADNSQIDRIFLSDTKQINQTTVESTTTPIPAILVTAFSCWAEGGVAYLAGIGTSAQTNLLYALPIGADWEYTSLTNNRLVLPKMLTPNCNKFVRIYISSVSEVGGGNYHHLGQPSEGYRVYCRTTGIDDDTGGWTLVDDSGDLSSLDGASQIQLMLEFKTIGALCIPSRILGATVLYEDLSTDSHFQPSVANSDKTNKRFAWRFSTGFGTSVPRLRIRLYDAVSGNGPLVDDDSTTQAGTWEKSTDGGSNWTSYNTTDKGNETTYIRFTPASLADNIRVRGLLTLY